jgi:hypothetical protein
VYKFHLREALADLSTAAWQAAFREIWRVAGNALPAEVIPESLA